MVDPKTLYIPKEDFDWEFYLVRNPDIKKAGISTLDKCYRHWVTYGCYENRWVKSVTNNVEKQVKLKPNEKFNIPLHTNTTFIHKDLIDLKFKIAIMIHVFNVQMMRFFVSYVNYLNNSYLNTNFDIYFNIVEENNPYQGDLKTYVAESLTSINNPNIHCYYNANRGGDIGGFLLLSQIVANSGNEYKYVIFVHSKNKASWRKELCQCIFDIQFEHLDRIKDVGIISAKKWVYNFDPIKQSDEYRRFKFHLIDLCHIYELSTDQPWQFIAGTMFLANMTIIKYIVAHEIDKVYHMLNRVDSVDINWLTVMAELRKDTRSTCNDYQYRLKYGKPLCSDYMIEHAFERIIGLICQQLKLKLIGQ